MRVLVACEFSGQVRDAFLRRGHEAVSCDVLEAERPGPHVVGDVAEVLADGWDLLIAFPPCTYLTRAGARYWQRPEWQAGQAAALEFVLTLALAPVQRIAIENPHGRLAQLWRRPDQIVCPSWFGAPYRKPTCLWLKNLPPLLATEVVAAPMRFEQYAYHSGSGHRPDNNAWRRRVRTPIGLATAMADQWG